jgi:hypothetical protein
MGKKNEIIVKWDEDDEPKGAMRKEDWWFGLILGLNFIIIILLALHMT